MELAKTIEVGLYAAHLLAGEIPTAERGKRAKRPSRAELQFLIADGQRAMQRFVTANLRLVVSVARKYGRSQMPLLDLVQEGNTGLIRAVEKFDYTKGLQVLHLRHLVGPPVHQPRYCAARQDRPAAGSCC